MNRRADKSLVKLYKDLMITRRDLIDLKQSIHNTIKSIKESDQRLKMIEVDKEKRKSAQQQLRSRIGQVPSSFPLRIRAKCEHCPLAFSSLDSLQVHQKEKHQICQTCKDEYSDSLEEHMVYTCGGVTIECECCHVSTKRKELDNHMKVCCFRECYKCKQSIYYKAYSYHLQECKRSQALIPPCRQLYRPKQSNQALILPCCLTINA